MRIETFNSHDPVPTSHNNSINTITTLVSNGSSGIEDIIQIDLSNEEQTMLNASADAVQELIDVMSKQ